MHPSSPINSFDELGLSPDILTALKNAGFAQPTPIQAQAIPPALAGNDVIGCAATGTGKTAAFALPMIEKLGLKGGARALVLAPTRELAHQIAEQVLKFGGGRGLKCATLIGGVSMGGQVRALRNGAQIIIATPGRLIDHLEQGTAKLDGIEWLVLDEADRMLDMGFKPQLDRILAKVPKARQTMLFSATMGGEVEKFARGHLKHPTKVEISRSGSVATRVDQKAYLVPQNEKTALLQALLSEDEHSTLVFTRTKRRADKVAKQLERAGLKVARIHADRSQAQRASALEGFRAGRYRVLVATDIAARGIDVAEIGHVVNYDLPHLPEDYVHRVGRTARAAASGRASSFAAPEEQPLLKDIERFTRAPLQRGLVPRESAIFQAAVKAGAQAGDGGRPSAPRHARGHHQGGGGGGRHHGRGEGGSTPRHDRGERGGYAAQRQNRGEGGGSGAPPSREGHERGSDAPHRHEREGSQSSQRHSREERGSSFPSPQRQERGEGGGGYSSQGQDRGRENRGGSGGYAAQRPGRGEGGLGYSSQGQDRRREGRSGEGSSQKSHARGGGGFKGGHGPKPSSGQKQGGGFAFRGGPKRRR